VRICFTALNAYPAIDARIAGAIGGVETRSWTFAKAAAQCDDVEVQFVVRHTGPLLDTSYDNVTLVPIVDRMYPVWQEVGGCIGRRAGFPWLTLKRFSPKLLWQFPLVVGDWLLHRRKQARLGADSTLLSVDADIFCTFGVQSHSAKVIASAHELGKPCVLMLASDGDLDELFVTAEPVQDRYGTRGDIGRWIIDHADRIVAQTEWQQQTLKEKFGRESDIVRNPIDIAGWDQLLESGNCPALPTGWTNYALWIGRSDNVHKRPLPCLELARLLPEVKFVMVMNRLDPDVDRHVRATAPGNVHIIESVPFEQIPPLFCDAAVFVNTSSTEGFANTWLQAAASGVPVATLEVGSYFLTTSQIGQCFDGDLAAMSRFIADVATGDGSAKRQAAAREYVIANYDARTQTDRLLGIFRNTQRAPRV